jgi:hypothetical protein
VRSATPPLRSGPPGDCARRFAKRAAQEEESKRKSRLPEGPFWAPPEEVDVMTLATRIVYLDRNILGDIRTRMICSTDAFETIRNAVRVGRIRIPLSLTVLEETLPVIQVNSSFKKVGDLQIVRELLDWSGVCIRPHVELLYEDVMAYARGVPLPSRWKPINFTPEEVLSPPPGKLAKLSGVVDVTKDQLARNLKSMQDAKQAFKDKFADENGKLKFAKDVTFPNIWKGLSIGIAGDLAEYLGVRRECEARGLGGLLELRTVKLYVGYGLSYGYGKFILGERMTGGDSRDHHHTVQASVADIFVTHDAALARTLKRIPIANFHIANLDGLLNWLKFQEGVDWDCLSSGLNFPLVCGE